MKNTPKIIFFDAVGTLFGIKGSVGEVYKAIAKKYGLTETEVKRIIQKSQ